MSFRSASTVSFGVDSSSRTSWTCLPRMPPDLLTRSAHHSVPRSPAVPTGAAMPARMARTPIFTGSEGTPFFAWRPRDRGNPICGGGHRGRAGTLDELASIHVQASLIWWTILSRNAR